MTISLKDRIRGVFKDASNEAIDAVYPDYYTTVIPKVEELEERIAEHRNKKDIGAKSTLDNLNTYSNDVEVLVDLALNSEKRVGALMQWELKEKRSNRFRLFLIPALLIIFGIVVEKAIDHFRAEASPRSEASQK